MLLAVLPVLHWFWLVGDGMPGHMRIQHLMQVQGGL